MGAVFELIADQALRAEDPTFYTACQVCERPGIPVYPCQGNLLRADGTADPDEDVYVACAACLNDERVAHLAEYRTDSVIERFAADPAAAKALLRRTPRIPRQMQGDDWPLCCGKLAEFIGWPDSLEALIQAQQQGRYWERGIEPADYDAEEQGEPESFEDVALFRCVQCHRLLWTFQPT